MDDSGKRKIYEAIQKSLSSLSNEKIKIVSYSPYYAVNGTSGIKFFAKNGESELPFFAGFSSDKKYSEKLLFGILKSESNEKIGKLNLDKDENGNDIQGKFSIDEKFLSADEDTQKSKLTKWLSEQITTVFSLYGVYNFSYSNPGFLRWFIFIELPWIILLSTSAYVCLLENIKDDVTFFPLSCKILCSVAFLLILFTLRLKNKIRKARNKRITLNPCTWGVSYIAKILSFTMFFPILLIPYFLKLLKLPFLLIYSILTAEAISSNSGNQQVNSSSNRPAGKPMYWWACNYCGTKIQGVSSPKNGSWMCPSSPTNDKIHRWQNHGQVGNITWQCSKCGLTLNLKGSPNSSSTSCGGRSSHNWCKL